MPPYCETHQKYWTDCPCAYFQTQGRRWYAQLHLAGAVVVHDAVTAGSARAAADHFLTKYPSAVEVQIWREED